MRRALGWLGRVFLVLLVAALLAPSVLLPFLDRVYYRGPKSDHFDGRRFFNPDGGDAFAGGHNLPRTAIDFYLGKGRVPWPDSLPVTPVRPPARVEGEAMRVTWVGHATVLIQTRGLNILTDPSWSERASPFSAIGPKRVRAPGVRFGDLPRIDVVLVSHNHYDHLDLPTLERLWRRDRPLIVTGLGNDTILGRRGIPARALDWGQVIALRPGIAVKAERVHHWTSRWGADRDRALWTGFAVTLPAGGNLFFAGDTGLGNGSWARAAARDGPYRLALLPIGAYLPRAMMRGNHADPAEAVRLFGLLGAARALAIHWGTFPLSWEGVDQAPKDLRTALAAAHIDPTRFRALAVGQSWAVPPLPAKTLPIARAMGRGTAQPRG